MSLRKSRHRLWDATAGPRGAIAPDCRYGHLSVVQEPSGNFGREALAARLELIKAHIIAFIRIDCSLQTRIDRAAGMAPARRCNSEQTVSMAGRRASSDGFVYLCPVMLSGV